MYATQDEYAEWLMGRSGVIPLAEFPFWSSRASSEIDLATFNRLHNAETLAEHEAAVIVTTCELAEILFTTTATSEKTLSSMSIGSYSESYVKDDKDETRKRIDGVLRRGLAMTGLLFRGA